MIINTRNKQSSRRSDRTTYVFVAPNGVEGQVASSSVHAETAMVDLVEWLGHWCAGEVFEGEPASWRATCVPCRRLSPVSDVKIINQMVDLKHTRVDFMLGETKCRAWVNLDTLAVVDRYVRIVDEDSVTGKLTIRRGTAAGQRIIDVDLPAQLSRPGVIPSFREKQAEEAAVAAAWNAKHVIAFRKRRDVEKMFDLLVQVRGVLDGTTAPDTLPGLKTEISAIIASIVEDTK